MENDMKQRFLVGLEPGMSGYMDGASNIEATRANATSKKSNIFCL